MAGIGNYDLHMIIAINSALLEPYMPNENSPRGCREAKPQGVPGGAVKFFRGCLGESNFLLFRGCQRVPINVFSGGVRSAKQFLRRSQGMPNNF